jgi:membrane peptidoglycan carboxypeptidase
VTVIMAPRSGVLRQWLLRAAGAVLAVVMLMGLCIIVGLLVTPPVDDMPQRVEAVLGAHGASRVPLSATPDSLSEALIAIEDERFYEHHGIDMQGLERALLADLYHRRALEGASTLSQQLIKNLYLHGKDDGWRKPKDLVMALKLELRFPKAVILESYLNSVYFGHGAWGIGQASFVYFQMAPNQLDLARASMLAGLPQSPSYYDLYRNPCAARARHFNVLAQMVHDGYITKSAADAAYTEPIGFPCR